MKIQGQKQAQLSSRPNNSQPVEVETEPNDLQMDTFESELGFVYEQYRNSNSRQEQANLKRELLNTVANGPMGIRTTYKELLGRLFEKNSNAWNNREASDRSVPKSGVEFNVMKYKLSAGQPLTGDNLFHLGRTLKLKNLSPMVEPGGTGVAGAQACKGFVDDVKRDINLLSASKAKGALGARKTKEEIERDLDLLGKTALKQQRFKAHILERLA